TMQAYVQERDRAVWSVAETIGVALDDLLRRDLGVAHGEHGDERQRRIAHDPLDGVTVERREAGDDSGAAVAELTGALDRAEEISGSRPRARIENPGERVHDVLGRDLAAVMELDALPEHERPRQAVARGLPELGERGCDGERLVELDQAVEDLLRHRAA